MLRYSCSGINCELNLWYDALIIWCSSCEWDHRIYISFVVFWIFELKSFNLYHVMPYVAICRQLEYLLITLLSSVLGISLLSRNERLCEILSIVEYLKTSEQTFLELAQTLGNPCVLHLKFWISFSYGFITQMAVV